MRSMGRWIIAGSLTALLAAAGWSSASVGVELPETAADKAETVTAGVVTQRGAEQAESPVSAARTPASAADFGQCVAAAAKDAPESGGQGWNPTQGCDHPSSNASSAPGLEIAAEQANSNASDALSTAGSARHSRAPARRPAR